VRAGRLWTASPLDLGREEEAMSAKRLTIAAALSVLSASIAAGRPNDACRATTDAASRSCRTAARADRSLGAGRCENAADAARKACRQQVASDSHDALGECDDQRSARKEVCARLGPDVYAPAIDPANFVAAIDNPLMPLAP